MNRKYAPTIFIFFVLHVLFLTVAESHYDLSVKQLVAEKICNLLVGNINRGRLLSPQYF